MDDDGRRAPPDTTATLQRSSPPKTKSVHPLCPRPIPITFQTQVYQEHLESMNLEDIEEVAKAL